MENGVLGARPPPGAGKGCATRERIRSIGCDSNIGDYILERGLSLIFKLKLTKENIGVWLSLVERLVRDQEVGCSNHLTPTTGGAGPIIGDRYCYFFTDHTRITLSGISILHLALRAIRKAFFFAYCDANFEG